MHFVCSFLKKCEIFYIATTDSEKPHLRPFGAAEIYNDRLYIQTGGAKAVAGQLHSNPNVEIVACDGENWMRISAMVEITTDEGAREKMLEGYPYLQGAYDESNPMLLLALTNATATWYPGEGETTVTKF